MIRKSLPVLVLAATVGLLAGCGSSAESRAIAACHESVESQLKSPSSAQWPSDGEHTAFETSRGHWSVDGWVDAENSYGASLRMDWYCEVSRDDAGDWTVDSMDGLT